MKSDHLPLETLHDIKSMMERSSRFISLSGWSGIAAGVCALGGAWLAKQKLSGFKLRHDVEYGEENGNDYFHGDPGDVTQQLILIAAGVFVAAFILAFLFTFLRSRKSGIEIWGSSARRLMWNTVVPMVVGGVVVLRLLDLKQYSLMAPCCLIFYGLALVNGSKYTLGEIRYLGYCELLLGLLGLWLPGYGLLFWAAGFGALHIIYGALMWWKYERQ